MKIVLAPDSFKESMTAIEVADAMEKGIRNVMSDVTIEKLPLADGGEGTFDVLAHHLQARIITRTVTGPLGKKIQATYGLTESGIALIEMAEAAGLQHLTPEERNPLVTTTYGVGELIKDALNRGASEFIIGIGGSATNDGGIGMAQALGVKVLDQTGRAVPFGGAGLKQVAEINIAEMDERIQNCRFTVAADVTNPLLGKRGATYVYGPQKGATREMLVELESAMERYAEILHRDVKQDVADVPGAGAAGGLGAACLAFLRAELRRGIELVMEAAQLEKAMQDADIILTGEGKMDEQTLYGKVPHGVAQLAQKYALPVLAFTGANQVTSEALYEVGITAIFPIVDRPMPLSEAMQSGEQLMTKAVENVFRLLQKARL